MPRLTALDELFVHQIPEPLPNVQTFSDHWRESLFGNELMSGYIASSGNSISRITVASLADIGYMVNMAAADSYTPPTTALRTATGTSGGTSGGPALVSADPETQAAPPARRSPASRWFAPSVRGPRAALAHWYA